MSRQSERLAKLQARLNELTQTITVIIKPFARRDGEPWMFLVHPDGSMTPVTPENAAADSSADNSTAPPQTPAAGSRSTSTPPVIQPPRRRRRRAV